MDELRTEFPDLLGEQDGVASRRQGDHAEAGGQTAHYLERLPSYRACRTENGQSLY